jgi:4-hydroxythreonine-4-phosphate dehydrogenase
MTSITLGITLGDPGGIGPEVALKALATLPRNIQCIIFGPDELKKHPKLAPYVTDHTWHNTGNWPITYGEASIQNGHHSHKAIETAVQWIQTGHINAIITAPISKTSLKLANYPTFDHTSTLQSLTNTPSVRMAFYTPALKTLLHTTHIPLAQVPHTLTPDALATTFTHAKTYVERLGLAHPRIALAGLNPHAGEDGLMGTEEIDLLLPALAIWNTQHPHTPISGPYPPDTLYHRAYKGEFDLIISLYHDQALIPIKLIAFDTAVNLTIGLPFIRTSPDHGTAYNIAYQDRANPSSMIEAIKLAMTLAT